MLEMFGRSSVPKRYRTDTMNRITFELRITDYGLRIKDSGLKSKG